MKKQMKISISILFGLLLALPATLLTAQPEAQAQHRVSERSQSSSRKTTTTTRSGTHIRNVRPNPNSSRPVYRPHRPQVYVPPHRHHVYHPNRHRTRLHTRYHHNRVVVHHHYGYVEPEPRVVVVEVERPRLPEISCPVRTQANSNEFEQWCETSRGVRHGTYVRRHSNGQIAIEGEYEYDQKEGLWTEWHSNGEPRLEGEYSNNERVGTWIRWDNRGQEVSVIDYR